MKDENTELARRVAQLERGYLWTWAAIFALYLGLAALTILVVSQ